jgi:hypothetical protein
MRWRKSDEQQERPSQGVEAKAVQGLMRHASVRTIMDSYTQALDEPSAKCRKCLVNLIMQTENVDHA